jgi:ATP-binding cassette subfamily C (CFTR/MRP) protein 4
MAIIGIITAIVVLPFTLIVVPFIVWGFIRLRQTFVRTTREIKRIEGIARSPLFALTAENLIGSTTIHANNLTEYCRQRFRAAHDAHTRAYFAFVSSSRCFAFQIDSLAFILMTTASALAVLFDTQQWLDIHPSTLGLALTLLLQLSQTNLPWIVRQSSEVTNQMVAIERILEYTNSPQEKPFETEYDDDHVNWPNINATSIAFDGYSTRYRGDLPLVLNGVSFTIPHGMRVGVVGRTGSSKSTLAQALFRLLEAEDGLISIGQVDISLLGLHKLRRAMSIVPQSPFLLSGATVRENLDPFSRYNDDDLDRALKVVQLYDLVHTDLPHGKESVISDGTLSVGQRQLFCLCRTILSKTNILVMDEATASCDVHTSDLIYKAIDVEFKSATILNIAHRLEMISGFDLVLVLGEGRVDQFGAPQDLLSDKAGTFFDMVSAQGLLDKFTTIDNKKQQL